MTTLETARLRLRPFRDDDLDAYAALCADPEVMRYVGDRGEPSREDAWRLMAMLAGHWKLRGFGMWAVEERDTGWFVGRVGLHYPEGWPRVISLIDPANTRSVRLAERIGERLQGETTVRGHRVAVYALAKSDWRPTLSPAPAS